MNRPLHTVASVSVVSHHQNNFGFTLFQVKFSTNGQIMVSTSADRKLFFVRVRDFTPLGFTLAPFDVQSMDLFPFNGHDRVFVTSTTGQLSTLLLPPVTTVPTHGHHLSDDIFKVLSRWCCFFVSLYVLLKSTSFLCCTFFQPHRSWISFFLFLAYVAAYSFGIGHCYLSYAWRFVSRQMVFCIWYSHFIFHALDIAEGCNIAIKKMLACF